MKNKKPEFHEDAFNCPHCDVYSQMVWHQLRQRDYPSPWYSSTCIVCSEDSLWLTEKSFSGEILSSSLVYPTNKIRIPPVDLPNACKETYREASLVENSSPRAAAALLRLCIDLLCLELKAPNKPINEKIKFLKSKGLPDRIINALDIVRVIGNNAVHPGEIDINENPSIVSALFKLVDLIVDNQITQPKETDNLFSILPEGAKEAIAKRDKSPN